MATRRDNEGRWHVEVCIAGRRLHRRMPAGSAARDAKRIEAELTQALHKQRTTRAVHIPGDPLLTDLLAEYADVHTKTLRSPKTARYHAVRIGKWCIGKRASEAKQAAKQFVKDARAQYAPATINKSLGTLTKALSLAHEAGRIPVNYGADINRLPENNARDTYLTLAQVQSIAQHCATPARAAIWIAVLGGLRRGEILALKPSDVMGDKLMIRAGNTKTLKTRSIPIVDALRPHLAELPIAMGFEGIKSAWRRARVHAGLPDVNFHDLRHSCASLLLQVPGVNLYTVGEILGHANIQSTKRYAHLSDDLKRAALDAVGKMAANGGR